MASLTQRATSKFWVACFTDRNGRRLKRSTKTNDRKRAQKIADEFEAAARRKRTALQVRRVISQLHKEITGEDMPVTTIRQFVKTWLETKAPEVADSTHSFYKSAADKFLTFMGKAADADINEVTREHVTRFRNQEAKTLAPKTVNHELKLLRMLFRAARRDAVIADDPTEFVQVVRKQESASRRPFTIAEIKSVLSVADAEWRSMIMFGLYTGQRLGDLAMLTWQNIDLQQNEIRLRTRKTDRTMILPIAAPLRRVIEELPSTDETDGPIHARAFGIVVQQGKTGHLSNQFADLLSEAGLRKKAPHRRTAIDGATGRKPRASGLSFHALRHTAVTLLKEAGIPSAVVMELVGHDSVAMSEHYTHVGRVALDKAANALPDVT